MPQTYYILRHVSRTRWLFVLAFLAAAIIAMLWLKPFSPNFNAQYWDQFSTIVNIGTLVAACVIAWVQLKQEWMDSLPKRLTLLCAHNGYLVLICREAYLAGKDDIRAWGQQIGQQMNEGKRLALNDPFIKQREFPISWDQARGTHYKPYAILIQLDAIPETAKAHSGTNPCVCWAQNIQGKFVKTTLHEVREAQVWPSRPEARLCLPDIS
jgi:hypothetical protein